MITLLLTLLLNIQVVTVDETANLRAKELQLYSKNEWVCNVKNDNKLKENDKLLILTKENNELDCNKEVIFYIKIK